MISPLFDLGLCLSPCSQVQRSFAAKQTLNIHKMTNIVVEQSHKIWQGTHKSCPNNDKTPLQQLKTKMEGEGGGGVLIEYVKSKSLGNGYVD